MWLLPPTDAIRTQLELILRSPQFSTAPALSRLLRHIVERTLEGRADELKEYTLGVEALQRSEGYDPRVDPIVRVQVRDLRRRLEKYYQGPGSRDPIRISIPRGAYRADFETIDSGTYETVQARPQAASVSDAPKASNPIGLRRRIVWLSAIVLITVLAISAQLWRMASRPRLIFNNRDWVVIAAFDNRTGEKLLDGSIEFALERELSRSRYVNVLPRERINDVLKLMRLSPGAVLTEDVARQIAIRDGGVKAVVAGRLERFRNDYALTVRVVDPASGETVAAFERQGPEDQLPQAARSISNELRTKLGDSEVKLSHEEAARLEKATTPSLPALRAFSSGMKLANQGQWEPAAELFEEALRQDPNFALAHIHAAHAYSDIGEDRKAGPHYEAAFRLAGTVTDRERLFILGSYYQRYLLDYEGAKAAYEALLQLYPDDYWAINNLMYAYEALGLWQEKLRAASRLLALRSTPSTVRFDPLMTLWWQYRRVQPDNAKAHRYEEELWRLRRDGALPLIIEDELDSDLDLEQAADRWNRGDVSGAAQQLDRVTSAAAASQHDGAYLPDLVFANLVMGRARIARALCNREPQGIPRDACLLWSDYVTGDEQAARQRLSELARGSALAFPPTALIAATFGRSEVLKYWSTSDRVVKLLKALLLLSRGRAAAAVDQLRMAPPGFTEADPVMNGRLPEIPGYESLWHRLTLAIALERQGKIDDAIAELKDDTRPSVVSFPFGWLWPRCRIKLAELYRKTGRPDDAAAVEREIRAYLSQADSDLPLLSRLSLDAPKHTRRRGVKNHLNAGAR